MANGEAAMRSNEDSGENDMFLRGGSSMLMRLKHGMRMPENFDAPWEDAAAGARWPNKMVPTDAYLSKVPSHVRNWLALKIKEASTVTEEDAGKSSQQSTSASKNLSPTAEDVPAPVLES